MHVLLVEDDLMLGEGMQLGLKQFGYVVDWVTNGDEALSNLLSENQFDIVVLDIGLPKKSGLDVLKAVRAKNISVPVLILTARELVEDRVRGLDAGADDYMVKPFDLGELAARIRALQRRRAGRSQPLIEFKNIKLNPASHSVTIDDKPTVVSRREFALLLKLLENVGRVLSRDQLSQTLYGWGDDIDSNALEVHIHNLRKKVGTDLIRTIRGVGYMVVKE